jgi:hypothetical protein
MASLPTLELIYQHDDTIDILKQNMVAKTMLLKLSNASTGIANAITRVAKDELKIKRLSFRDEDFKCDDVNVFVDIVRLNLTNMPIFQNINYDYYDIRLNIENNTNIPKKVYTDDILIIPKKKTSATKTSATSATKTIKISNNMIICLLYPNKYIGINFNVIEDYGFNNGAFCEAYNTRHIPYDMALYKLNYALFTIQSAYLEETKKLHNQETKIKQEKNKLLQQGENEFKELLTNNIIKNDTAVKNDTTVKNDALDKINDEIRISKENYKKNRDSYIAKFTKGEKIDIALSDNALVKYYINRITNLEQLFDYMPPSEESCHNYKDFYLHIQTNGDMENKKLLQLICTEIITVITKLKDATVVEAPNNMTVFTFINNENNNLYMGGAKPLQKTYSEILRSANTKLYPDAGLFIVSDANDFITSIYDTKELPAKERYNKCIEYVIKIFENIKVAF